MSVRRQALSEAGFTLVEMLAVIAVIALATSVAVPLLARPSDGARLDATARDLASALRLTRAAAIARNAELALTIDVDARTYTSAAVGRRQFSPDVAFELKIADAERPGRSRGGIRFFPDGSSTGGDVSLTLRGREARICVNWLTGATRLSERC